MAWACNDHYAFEMILLSLYCIVTCFILYICAIALHRIIRTPKQYKGSKLLTVSHWIFFVTAIIFIISRTMLTVTFCFALTLHRLFWNLVYLSYMAHLSGLLLLLYSRLRDVFNETVYVISKWSTYCFYSVFGLLIATGLFLLTGNYSFTLAVLALLLFIVLITCQVLAWAFVYKLYSIRKLDGESAKIFDMKFLRFLRKYAVLSLICVMFTTSYSIVATISAVIGYGWFWAEMLSIIITADVFVDTLSMFLAFQENDKYYVCLCWICHNHCPCLMCMKSHNNEHNIKIELHRVGSKVASTTDNDPSTNNSLSPRTVSPS